MPLPSDPAYYADCYDLFARALAAPNGVQKKCLTQEEALAFRSRLHQARALSRLLSKKVYSEDHPLYNTSEYYRIVVRIAFDEKRNLWLVRLEKRELRHEEIEEIMPAEVVSEKEAAHASIDEDGNEFDLQPETNLDPSLERTDRPRRL